MSLTLEEVEHIAKLARLELSDDEKARYREQLSAILDYVAKLQQLDTADIPPTTAALGSSAGGRDSRLRPDRARPPLARKALLKNAPEVQDDQFKIPPVFAE